MPPKPHTPRPSAVIYVRVSSDAQIDGTSLDTQREQCRACARRLGLAVLSEHEDAGKSARTTAGRDALAAALDAATRHGAALIVHKFDRISRNLGDGYALRDLLAAKGCRVISATEGEACASPVGKAMYAMMMAFAELDNDMRTERCHSGMRARAMQGGWSSNPPIGFRLARNAAGVTVLVPDGLQSEILRPAFLDFARGKTDKAGLIRALKAAGHPDSTITRIIRSPVYGGIIRNALTGGQDVTAAFPGLITADQWYTMEAKLSGKKRAHLKDNPAFPFTGTVLCGLCGLPLRSGFSTGSKGKSFGYYFCKEPGHPKAARDDIHAQVDAMLRRLGGIPPFLQLLKQAVETSEISDPHKGERERHRRNVARLEPQLTRLRAALLDGTFTPDEFDAERTRITSGLSESREWLAANEAAVDRRSESLDILMTVFSDPAALMSRITVPQMKSLVRIVFKEFRLSPEKKIEPSQESVFSILTTANDDLLRDGRSGGS